MYDYICQHCKTPFQDKNKNRKYCSQKCTKSNQKYGVERPCSLCGKTTYIPEWKIKTNKKHFFCCREHSDEFQKQRRPTRTCEICGIAYRKRRKQDSRYCSNACKFKVTHDPRYLAEMRRSQSGRKPTKLEIAGYETLEKIGIKFEKQFIIDRFVVEHLFQNIK